MTKKKSQPKPKSIKIGDFNIEVIYSGIFNNIIDTYMPSAQGKYVASDSVMHIFEHKNEDMTKNTILHEVLHGIDIFMNTKLNEDQIIGIANGLMSTVKENKNTFKYLFGIN